MGKIMLPLTILVFSLVFQYGNAAMANCPTSHDSTVLYFDLEKLGQMSLQEGFKDKIHSPMFCKGGNDSECIKQQCCFGKVGCCFIHPNNNVKKCGCKSPESKVCTDPAPLAIFSNSVYDTENKTETSFCLSEKQADGDKYVSTRNTALITDPKAQRFTLIELMIGVAVLGLLYSTLTGRVCTGNSSSGGLLDQNDRCLIPTNSSLIYLDIEKLRLATLQQDLIQSPQTCVADNDGDCSDQQCCHGEVGCCYINNHHRKCGCKKPEDETCTYPAPLAILAHSECESNHIRNGSVCLRERRGNEGFISTNESALQLESGILPEIITNSVSLIIDVGLGNN